MIETGHHKPVTQPPDRPYSGPAGSTNQGQPGQQTYEQQTYGQQQPYGQQPYGQPPADLSYPQAAGTGTGVSMGRDPRLAEPWRRFVGWIVDWIIISIITSFVWIPAAFRHATTQNTGSYVIAGVSSLCIAVLYYWLLTGFWGTTIGKRLVGAWVVTAASWSKAGLGAAFVRAVVFDVIPAIPIIGWLWFLLDNLWLLWDERRQALHDKAAGTIVVKGAALGR